MLERGEVANTWKTERWDSLRLLTPNWQSRLPGFTYDGDDPDGFMTMPEVIAFIERYAGFRRRPVQTGTTVTGGAGDVGRLRRHTPIRAPGARRRSCWRRGPATSPPCRRSHRRPGGHRRGDALQYRNPDQLADGGVLVVGASATGIQLADEIHRSGRPVTLAVGAHVRAPRTYSGSDIQRWMDDIGLIDERYDEVDDIVRVRRLPSLQIVGTPTAHDA